MPSFMQNILAEDVSVMLPSEFIIKPSSLFFSFANCLAITDPSLLFDFIVVSMSPVATRMFVIESEIDFLSVGGISCSVISDVGVSLPVKLYPRSPGPLVIVSRAIQLFDLFSSVSFFVFSNSSSGVRGILSFIVSAPAINRVMCHSHRNGLP